MKRLVPLEGLWNRLGFPSDGVERVALRLARFPRKARRGMAVLCNIGPHPAHVAQSASPTAFLTTAREELEQLVDALASHADCFVVNLSSPNTPGLRGALEAADLGRALVEPVRERIRAHGKVPLLLKLPPEDTGGEGWNEASLSALVSPLVDSGSVDGFVAVNTSTRLATEHVSLATSGATGGVSGAPLRPIALDTVRLLRGIVGPGPLIIGCGGVTQPEHAPALLAAGADLVELYSGLVFFGPGLVSACARSLHEHTP